jgi:hypothetical protein
VLASLLYRVGPNQSVRSRRIDIWDPHVALTPPLDEFEPFEPDRYRELPDVPDAHRSYLRRKKEEGKPALQFVHIPQVLVHGPIDTRGLRRIAWDTPAQQPPAMRRMN